MIGDDELEREGERDQMAGKAKEAIDDVADKAKKAADSLKDKFS